MAGLAVCALTASLVVTGTGALAASTPWTLVPSPNVTLSGGKIESVSCSAPQACTGVGTDLNTSGINVTLAERWNGTTWQHQSTPNPTGGPADPSQPPDLLGVSCPASNFCAAVGNYQADIGSGIIVETWNGQKWTLQPFDVAVGDFPELSGVSCTSATSCEAVGSYSDPGTGNVVTLAAAWNGTTWSQQPTPNPAGAFFSQFNTVSCTSPTFCEAWGGDPLNAVPALAEKWNGKSWALQTVPTSAAVNSVSCASPTFCEAVDAHSAAAYKWNGSHWSTQTLPSPVALTNGVSCVSSKFCEAVAHGNASVGATWNGSAWSVQPIPSPPQATISNLNGVSCPSASSCEAGGYFEVAGNANDQKALAEAWNGTTWGLQNAVAPAGATYNRLTAVSCVSATFCEAVGNHTDSSGNQVNLAEMWNGTTWKVQSTPSPQSQFGPTDNEFLAVSCVSTKFCEAVGTGPNGSSAEVWNGTAWKVQARPGTAVAPQSVSCTATDFCMTTDGFGQVDIWNGSAWSAQPNVPGFSYVGSVSCASASFCEIVGEGPAGESAAAWNGSTWSAQPTAGGQSETLTAVSCLTASSCEAVGGSGGASLAENWNGSTWTVQPTPNPAEFPSNFLDSVWCTSADACTAVGYSQNSSGISLSTLAEVWDGTAWSLRTTPNGSTTHNILSGVSCGASNVCQAVGQTFDAGMVVATLIESGD